MLREFARVEAFDKVNQIDLLPLRSLTSDQQSIVLGKLWNRLQNDNNYGHIEQGWFVRELLVEVSNGLSNSANRFNPDTIKLLNSVLLLSSSTLTQSNSSLLPTSTDINKLDSFMLSKLAQMDNHSQTVCLQRALVTTEGTPLEKLIMIGTIIAGGL